MATIRVEMNRMQPLVLRQMLTLLLIPAMGDCYAALEDFSEKSLIQDVPVVLSASRLRQPVSETPNAVTVIDRAMIQASGFRKVADLFSLVPGMFVSYFNGWRPIVSYRGATDEYTRRMQVLIDGRSVYLQPYGTVDWEDLPLHINDIDHIEVVRGPAATSYGSNSIMGVINIVTRDASAFKGASVAATKGNAGNAGISDVAAHIGGNTGRLDYRLTFARISDNGFDFPQPPSSKYYPFYDGYGDSSTTKIVTLRGNYYLSMANNIDFQLGFSDGIGAEGTIDTDPANASLNMYFRARKAKKYSAYQQVNWLHAFNQDNDIQLTYYHISRSSVSESYSLPAGTPVDSYMISDRTHTHRHDLELQHTYKINANNRVVWGIATRYESEDSPSLFRAPQNLHQSRLFVHDEWRVLPSLILNSGAMLEDNGMGARRVSPRAALNYHISPQHTLRAGISVAHRNPALAEQSSYKHYPLGTDLLLEWRSSGGLKPERALSREIGYIGSFQNGLTIDARVYNDQISDIIFLDAKPAPESVQGWAYDFGNEVDARYTGLEMTAKYQWAQSSLIFNYARQFTRGSLTFTPGPLSQAILNLWMQRWNKTVPLNSGSLLYITKLSDDMLFSAGYYHQGSVWVLVGMDPQPLTRRVDMRVAKQFKPVGKVGGGEISLVVQNLFQQNKGESVGYSAYFFDRRAYVTATVNF